ncbi:hypothetical protein [Streptomyces sp. LN500]|uniref:hypothetical protein n=1 Tax=Streptomyces sp. LN500 TaxID=3112978 RepID=UPI003718722A
MAVGLVMRDGGEAGIKPYAALVVMGAGRALGCTPTLTGAPAAVRPEGAADASDALMTVTRLGRVIGAAAFGTLLLNRLDASGAHESADALWVCALALLVAAIEVRRQVSYDVGGRSILRRADPLAGPWQNRTAGGGDGPNGRERAMPASRHEVADLPLVPEVSRVSEALEASEFPEGGVG